MTISVPKTILVVEDDLSIRETLKEVLQTVGYRVVTAENGREGLEKLALLPRASLVLLDMMMPIMDGQGFLNAVLKDALLAPIPVVVVSATGDENTIRGAKAFIKKPADLDLLLRTVASYVGS